MLGNGILYLAGFLALSPVQGAPGHQKPVVHRPFHIEGRGAAADFKSLWSRSDVVIEGVIEGERPADYDLRGTLVVNTMYDVRVVEVYKASNFVSGSSASIQVRRQGGIRDLGDRIEEHVPDNFPLFKRGGRFIMFLRETEWVQPSPHQGRYYYGTTYGGPDSFFQVHPSSVSTSARTLLAQSTVAERPEALRNKLRQAGGGK